MRRKFLASLFVGIWLLSSCDSVIRTNETRDKSPEENLLPDPSIAAAQTKSGPLPTTYVVKLNSALATRDADICRGWSYDGTSVLSDLAALRESSAEDWGHSCYQYACSAFGAIEYDGKSYDVEANAAGWILLKDKTSPVFRYFVSVKKNEHFLTACDCCEQ